MVFLDDQDKKYIGALGDKMISVLLVEPGKPGNIGAVARVMANFGFKDLILANPKCDHLSKEAVDRASHAKSILSKAKVADFSALNRFDYLIGTTSRLGTDYNIPRSPVSPRQVAERLSSMSRKTKIAILFGRESSGLKNEEIRKCDFIVAIPTSRDYPAMNISHSVAVILYEIYSATGKERIDGNFNPITSAEKGQIIRMINSILDLMQFSTKQKKETQVKLWKRLVGKSFMTRREAYALMGFLRKIR